VKDASTGEDVAVMASDHEALQAVLDANDQPIFALDRELRYTAFNHAHAVVMRALYGADIALGGRLPDYQTVAADRETSTANLERALAGERVVATAFSGENESRRSFEVVHVPQTDPHGTVVGVAVRAYDVTERRRTEAQLRESEAHLQATLDSTADGILAVDDSGRVLVANRRFADLWHIPDDLLNSGDDAALLAFVVDQLADPEAFLSKVRSLYGSDATDVDTLTFKDGRVFVRHSSAMMQGSAVTGRVWSFGDVTERLRQEEELQQTRDLLEEAQSISHLGGWEYDVAEDRVTWTEEVYRIHGLELDYDPDRAERDIGFYAPQSARGVADAFRRAVDCGDPYDLEAELDRADGERIWVRTVGRPVVEDERVVRVIGNIMDITDRKRFEAELRETRDYLENLIGYANAPIIVWNAELCITRFNQAFEELTQRAAGEVVGQHLELLFPDDRRRAQALALVTEASAGERWQAVEIPIRRADGEVRTVLWNSATVFAADGMTPVATIAQGQDITERVIAERALRESESRFRQLAESLPQLVWTFEPGGPCDYLSGQWVAYTGIPEAPQLGFGWLDQLHPDDREPSVAAWEAAVAAGTDFHTEFRIRRHDGEYRWFDTQAVRLRDADGSTVKWFGSNTDITERRHAEDKLAESEDKFRYMFDRSSVARSITQPSGEIEVNEAFLEMVGYTREELGERATWQQISHPDDAAHTSRIVASIVSGERASARFEKRYLHKDGSVIWADVSTSLRRNSDGDADYFMTTIVDITERKRAEEEILRLNAELEQRVLERTAQLGAANKELEAFAYSVSHDLRAPLRHISGFASILVEDAGDALDENGRDCLATISDSVREMGVLIDDLLQFSRVGRMEMQIADVDMEEVLAEAVAPIREETADRAIEWSIGPLPHVLGDHNLLRQVWANLVGNAVKYSRDRAPARIEIGAVHGDGDSRDHVFFVRDNGVGFDMQYADKLFRVFQRLHSSAEFEGTGIGLANVQRIITRLGGRVWAEAELDHGATFSFALPRPKDTS
jgi:PAS domain S-box-containing protein